MERKKFFTLAGFGFLGGIVLSKLPFGSKNLNRKKLNKKIRIHKAAVERK